MLDNVTGQGILGAIALSIMVIAIITVIRVLFCLPPKKESPKKTRVFDWQGGEVTESELPNKVVTAWEVDPPLHTNSFDVVWIRSYHDVVSYLENNLDIWLSGYTEEELRKGITLKLRIFDTHLEDLPPPDINE